YDDYFPCRLLMDPVSMDFYRERYEISRDRGPFNHHLSVRFNRNGTRSVIQGHTLHHQKRGQPLVSRALTREELTSKLLDDVGMSPAIIDQWIACGALNAAYEPTLTPPAPLTRKPPSTRGAESII